MFQAFTFAALMAVAVYDAGQVHVYTCSSMNSFTITGTVSTSVLGQAVSHFHIRQCLGDYL